jgi:uncharacterized repeat protein (TIGR02543 family)
VYVEYGTFTKQSGGTIYGSNESSSLKNTATKGDSYGHAVYVETPPARIRTTTAGSGVTLYSDNQTDGWEYTVTFDANGGDFATETRIVEYGGAVGSLYMPANPTRSGYGFGGWFTAQYGGDEFTASTPVTAGITVYARWNSVIPVQIALQPRLGDPSLANKVFFVDQQADFSAAGDGYVSWQWYWQGRPISGAYSDTYTLAANSKSAGVYEVAVVATTAGGAKLSARCRVTIKGK